VGGEGGYEGATDMTDEPQYLDLSGACKITVPGGKPIREMLQHGGTLTAITDDGAFRLIDEKTNEWEKLPEAPMYVAGYGVLGSLPCGKAVTNVELMGGKVIAESEDGRYELNEATKEWTKMPTPKDPLVDVLRAALTAQTSKQYGRSTIGDVVIHDQRGSLVMMSGLVDTELLAVAVRGAATQLGVQISYANQREEKPDDEAQGTDGS
jgi:hypothetical protein